MVTTHDADGGADPSTGGRCARRRGLRRAVRDRMLALGLTQKALGERAGLSKSGVGRLLSGERQPRMDTLERVAAALGVPVAALLAPPVDPASTPGVLTPGDLSPAGGAPLHFPEQLLREGPAGAGGAGVVVYPGYALWGRTDPRVPGGPRPEGGAQPVMREAGGTLGGPGEVFAVLVGDDALAAIETTAGRVRAGWRLFVDRRLAATARPGAIVAGMSATGRLVVGALELRGGPNGDAWAVFTGQHREALDREDVLGEVVEYQAPPAAIGHIRGAAQAEGTFFVAADADARAG